MLSAPDLRFRFTSIDFPHHHHHHHHHLHNLLTADGMSVLTLQSPGSPSSPISRRGSWVDPSTVSACTSRRASFVDLANNDDTATASTASLVQLLSNLADSNKLTSRAAPHSMKRKFETDPGLSPFRKASAADIHLPSDPTRRASIINLATAAAAAVLQGQSTQERRPSTLSDYDAKRQRVQQLDRLYEQARNATVASGSLAEDNTPQPENESSESSAVNLATSLGITPKGSPRITAPSSPSTPKQQHSAPATLSPSVDANASLAFPSPQARSPLASRPVLASFATSSSSSPTLASSSVAVQSTQDSEAFHQGAKEAANHFSRFYAFESQWARKALEIEQRRASVRIDPLSGPCPQTLVTKPGSSSPSRQSAPASRAASRGASPSLHSSSATPQPAALSLTANRGASVGGLASVLSNFAELIEHRQRSCSGLEALAKQAKEMPKRLSQPNPHFRTTFDEFSFSRRSQTPSSSSAMSRAGGSNQAIVEDSVENEDAANTKSSSPASRVRLQTKSEDKSLDETTTTAGDVEARSATPRSSMSIASML